MPATLRSGPPTTGRLSDTGGPPPERDEDGRGGGSKWVELARAKDDIEAHLLLGRLHEAGIETRTLKDRTAPGAWLYGGSNPWAPVAVLVRSFELDQARLVLAELAYITPAAPEPTRRPPQAPRHRLLWIVTAIVLGVMFTGALLVELARAGAGCRLPILCSEREVPAGT